MGGDDVTKATVVVESTVIFHYFCISCSTHNSFSILLKEVFHCPCPIHGNFKCFESFCIIVYRHFIVFISYFSVAQFHLEKYKDALASFQTGSQLDKADANFSQWIEKCKAKIPGSWVQFVGYMIVKFKSLAKKVIFQTVLTASLNHIYLKII